MFLFLDFAHISVPVCVSVFVLNRVNLRYPSSSRFWPKTTCWIWTIFDRLKVPFSGPQMQKRFHIHKEQGPLCVFIYMSRDMTKPTKCVCAQRRLRSAWASAQSDQGLRSLIRVFAVRKKKAWVLSYPLGAQRRL